MVDAVVALACRPAAERQERAQGLAAALHCRAVLIFVLDPTADVPLPALGFPQTLPPGPRWRELLAAVGHAASASATVPDPYDRRDCEAVAMAARDGTVLVRLDPACPLDGSHIVLRLLPLIGMIFRSELNTRTEMGQAQAITGVAADAQRFAEALDLARRDLEAALQRAEDMRQQVAAIVAYSPDPMFLVDTGGVLVQANERARALLGLVPSMKLEACLERRVPPAARRDFLSAIDAAMRDGHARDVRIPSLDEAGRPLPTALNAAALYGRQGGVVGIIGTLRDMTTYERMVQELERSRCALQEKIADLELFHDVAVGRELRMIEMERELTSLRSRSVGPSKDGL